MKRIPLKFDDTVKKLLEYYENRSDTYANKMFYSTQIGFVSFLLRKDMKILGLNSNQAYSYAEQIVYNYLGEIYPFVVPTVEPVNTDYVAQAQKYLSEKYS